MKTINFPLSILFIVLLSTFVQAQKLMVLTEEVPPFNYTFNSKITGVSTDIVNVVLKKTNYEYKISSLPWARAYKMSQENPNSLIFSISRRIKREKLFQWIGIIVPSKHSVFALKNRKDIKISTLNDLKKYQIGTTIEDARETYLAEKGFDITSFQRVAGNSSYLQNYKKLKLKRIDILPMPDAVMNYIVKQAGDNPDETIQKIYTLSEISVGGYYIAASLSTPKEVVEKIRKTLEAFKKTKEYQLILKKWGI